MTDSTQELDDTLNVLYMQGEDIGKLEYGSATHQITSVKGAKQAILDWHNKQTLELLDRLHALDDGMISGARAVSRAIEAERNKLKEE